MRPDDTAPKTAPPGIFCVRCEVLLGRQSTYIGKVGPLCEVCADRIARDNYLRSQKPGERKTWAMWLRSLMGWW